MFPILIPKKSFHNPPLILHSGIVEMGRKNLKRQDMKTRRGEREVKKKGRKRDKKKR